MWVKSAVCNCDGHLRFAPMSGAKADIPKIDAQCSHQRARNATETTALLPRSPLLKCRCESVIDYLLQLPSSISQRGPSDRGNLAAQFRHRGTQSALCTNPYQ